MGTSLPSASWGKRATHPNKSSAKGDLMVVSCEISNEMSNKLREIVRNHPRSTWSFISSSVTAHLFQRGALIAD